MSVKVRSSSESACSVALPLLVCPFVIWFVCFWHYSFRWARASSCTRFLDHTQRRTTVSRTSLDEWSARRRDLYLTTQNTYYRQTSMPPVGFEPTVSDRKIRAVFDREDISFKHPMGETYRHTHGLKSVPVLSYYQNEINPFSLEVTICTTRLNSTVFCLLPIQCIYMFCIDLTTNSDYFPVHHWSISCM
jgi:hypothetical protein